MTPTQNNPKGRRMSRRFVLRGLGGAALALPILESFAPREATAAPGDDVDPFAIFFRQANGVAAALSGTALGSEPERFWPTQTGPLTAQSIQGRSLDELSAFAESLLVVGNVRTIDYNFNDGHARGAIQILTARGPLVPGVAHSSEANGESIDHRIGRELNLDGRESMFLYAGAPGGWLGGPCISHRGPGSRRAAIHNPVTAYEQMMGIDSDQFATLIARQKSINDLVHDEMAGLLARPELSTADRQRLELHQQSIRDVENGLECTLAADQEAALAGESAGYASDDGDAVMAAVRAHMDIATLAVACGFTRSVAIQVGSGNDGSTRFRNLETGQLMENYHFLSHRRTSHGAGGEIISDSDLLHHYVDRHFAMAFKHLVTRLSEYSMPNGSSLLDAGMAIWHNDNGTGPGHLATNVPFVIAGSGGGQLRQGEYVRIEGTSPNHARLLNTLGSVAGLRDANGEFISDFGDPEQDRHTVTELLA